MVAASLADLDTVKAIIPMCQDVDHVDSFGRNAIHYAAAAKQANIVTYLASDAVEMDVDKQSIGGCSPAMAAVKSGDEATVKAVLNSNGNPFYRDVFGREPTDHLKGNQNL